MNTYSANTIPMQPKIRIDRTEERERSPVPWLTSVPQTIINSATDIGATTGPHQGSGKRKRMSQSSSDEGQSQMALRTT
jgi:hypothetical protein